MRSTIICLVLLMPAYAGADPVKPEISEACEKINTFAPIFARRFDADPELATALASCTPEGQEQMTKNDKMPRTPTNSGASADWVRAYFGRIAVDGYLPGKDRKR